MSDIIYYYNFHKEKKSIDPEVLLHYDTFEDPSKEDLEGPCCHLPKTFLIHLAAYSNCQCFLDCKKLKPPPLSRPAQLEGSNC